MRSDASASGSKVATASLMKEEIEIPIDRQR